MSPHWLHGLAAVAFTLPGQPVGAQTATPDTPRTFTHWVAACDNGWMCQATSLMGGGDEEGLANVAAIIDWPSAPDARPTLRLVQFPSTDPDRIAGAVQLVANTGQTVAARVTMRADQPSDAITLTPEIYALLRAATTLSLHDQHGAEVGFVQLRGLNAALLYIEERQHRVNSVTALVRRGPMPVARITRAPAYPSIRRATPTSAPARSPNEAQISRWLAANACSEQAPAALNSARLDSVHSLALMLCSTGAYQPSYIAYLGTEGRGAVRWAPAPFDYTAPGVPGTRPMLGAAEYDADSGILSDSVRYRGVGDCGATSHYVWDGRRFRLTLRTEMRECGGSDRQLQTWRADVAP